MKKIVVFLVSMTFWVHAWCAHANMYPRDGVVITDRYAEFTWPAVADAEWYQIWIRRNGEPYHSAWIKSETRWEPASPLLNGEYAWYVRAWGPQIGMQDFSAAAEFQVIRSPGPIAFGVLALGFSISGSGNYSAQWDNTEKRYEVTIDDVTYNSLVYTTTVTPISGEPVFATTQHSGGKLWIHVFRPDGSRPSIGPGVSFVVHRM